MRKQKGFSLIELLIVVAIILVISAIAIPNLMRSRIAANEASAVGSLRTINSAQFTYAMTFPTTGFATSLFILGPVSAGSTAVTSANANLLDNVLGAASNGGASSAAPNAKSGYNFYITASAGSAGSPTSFYQSNANPISTRTGTRYFYSDASGVIHYNASLTATSTDAPLQ